MIVSFENTQHKMPFHLQANSRKLVTNGRHLIVDFDPSIYNVSSCVCKSSKLAFETMWGVWNIIITHIGRCTCGRCASFMECMQLQIAEETVFVVSIVCRMEKMNFLLLIESVLCAVCSLRLRYLQIRFAGPAWSGQTNTMDLRLPVNPWATYDSVSN